MEKLVHHVGDLRSSERTAVEAIIGHALRDDQQLYIAAFDTSGDPAVAVRRQAWRELEAILLEAQQNVRDSGVSAQELERTIDEACDQVRYGK